MKKLFLQCNNEKKTIHECCSCQLITELLNFFLINFRKCFYGTMASASVPPILRRKNFLIVFLQFEKYFCFQSKQILSI